MSIWSSSVWGGGGGSAGYTQVATFADLPLATNNTGKIYIVLTATGIWPFNRKPAGMYYSDGVAWTYMSAYPDLMQDANFGIVNTADPTKVIKFDASGITTGNSRILASPNRDGVIALNQTALTKEPTGFDNPENVIVTYDETTQKITLTGTWTAYYQGEIVTALVTGWESTAHTNTTGNIYFLSYNGNAFVWTTNGFPGFDQLLIAVVYYRASGKFASRECHGFQPWQSHQTDHYNIGTYRTAGGDISGLTLANTTPALRRPDISGCTIWDEDCRTINPALTSKLYSQRYLTGTATINYNLDAADIVPLSTANPYYNPFNGSDFVQTLMPANSVMTVWLYEVPVTADVNSQKIAHVFVQGQSITQATNGSAGALVTARNTEKLKTTLELNLGDSAVIAAEYVAIHKFIIQYTGGDWTITDSIAITGSKANQAGAAAGSWLTSVSVDGATITGSGVVSDPLTATGIFSGSIGAGVVTPRAKLDILASGTANTDGDVSNSGIIVGPNVTTASTTCNFGVFTNDAVDADLGGSIGFGYRYLTADPRAILGAVIRTGKTTNDGTSTNYGGYLAFCTRQDANLMSEKMRITAGGKALLGTVTPFTTSQLSVSGGDAYALVGATVITDATTKNFRLGGAHYTNAEEPVLAVFTSSTATENKLYIGGGSSLGNAATTIRFYTASDNTTTTGTASLEVTAGGYTKIGGDATGTPAIRVKTLTGTTGAAEGNTVTVAHGLTGSKIISISCVVRSATNSGIPTEFTSIAGYQYSMYYASVDVNVINHPTNSENILSKPFVITIIYEE